MNLCFRRKWETDRYGTGTENLNQSGLEVYAW